MAEPFTMQVWPAPMLRRGHEVEDLKAAQGNVFPVAKELLVMMLQERDEAYERGYADALNDYGIWKDGEKRIGCMNRRVSDILAERRAKKGGTT